MRPPPAPCASIRSRHGRPAPRASPPTGRACAGPGARGASAAPAPSPGPPSRSGPAPASSQHRLVGAGEGRPDLAGIEIEGLADVHEGERPCHVVRIEPELHLGPPAGTGPVPLPSRPLQLAHRILEHRRHQPLLRCAAGPPQHLLWHQRCDFGARSVSTLRFLVHAPSRVSPRVSRAGTSCFESCQMGWGAVNVILLPRHTPTLARSMLRTRCHAYIRPMGERVLSPVLGIVTLRPGAKRTVALQHPRVPW